MQNELTESQVNFYQENGFLAIENFLDAAELAEWRRCTDESVEERLGNSVEFMTNQMDAKPADGAIFDFRVQIGVRGVVQWIEGAPVVYQFDRQGVCL